jgi:hypothetical protein
MSKIISNVSKLADLNRVYQEEITKVSAFIADDIGECFKSLCEKVPSIKKLGWSQFTPYFNDGDPCEFSANGYTIAFSNDVSDYDLAYDSSCLNKDGTIQLLESMPSEEDLSKEYPDWKSREELFSAILKQLTIEQRSAIREFFEIMSSLSDDLLKFTFEDHSLVIYSSDGSHEVEEYEHE